MIEKTLKLLGVEFTYAVPANLEEATTLPGSSPELVFDMFLKQSLYHGSYGAIRAKLCDLLEEKKLGVRQSFLGKALVTRSKKTEGEGEDAKEVFTWLDAKGKEVPKDKWDDIVTETEAVFFKRVCAERGVEATEFKNLIQQAANECPFDVTRKERTAAAKKAAKGHIKIAMEIANNGGLEKVLTQLGAKLGKTLEVTGDVEVDINTLALAIGENERREADERKNKYLTMGD